MRTHMTNVINKRIKKRTEDKKKVHVKNVLNLKDHRSEKEENKVFGYSFKNLIKEWRSFGKFFENKEPVINILKETREKVETEFIECLLKSLKNTDESGIGSKKKGLFRMVGKLAKDFSVEPEIHRDMMAKFKLKFEKSSVFRGLVEIMRENEQSRFRPKFDRTWMRSLIVTIHQDVILGKLTEFTKIKTIKKTKPDPENTNEDGTTKRKDLVDFKDQVKLNNSRRNIMLNQEAEKVRRATVYEERKVKKKEEEDIENKKNTQGDKYDKEITSKKEEEKTFKESTKATEEAQKQENQKS